MSREPRVAVVGGGLAGLAAAVALQSAGRKVELFEARSRLGGRASSFRDPATGELIDYCQHVSMACCTNLADFCRRVGIDGCFRRFDTLHFIATDGARYDVAASRWLPAPLHLGPALWRLKYLSRRERFSIARAMWRLARWRNVPGTAEPSIAQWLRGEHQTQRAMEQFWSVVLVSALAETLDRIAVSAAQKVFVLGFMATAAGYEVLVPELPLGELYGARLLPQLGALGVQVHRSTPVERVTTGSGRALGIQPAGGAPLPFAAVVLAVPWRHVSGLLEAEAADQLPGLAQAARFESSPITGVHLWFDRPLMDLPHAVLVGRTSDWVFARGAGSAPTKSQPSGHYYQVVISASRGLIELSSDEIITKICGELAEVFPQSPPAELLHARVVTERHAVFSPLPGSDAARPGPVTSIEGLYLAGDWTSTRWPATMESAVRSGYRAAETVLADVGEQAKFIVDDLPRGWFAGGLGLSRK